MWLMPSSLSASRTREEETTAGAATMHPARAFSVVVVTVLSVRIIVDGMMYASHENETYPRSIDGWGPRLSDTWKFWCGR